MVWIASRIAPARPEFGTVVESMAFQEGGFGLVM
jgi:hypothetical protein